MSDGPAATTAPVEPPDPDIVVPRTQIVMLTAAVGLLIGPAVVYIDHGSWDEPTKHLADSGAFDLWVGLLAIQTMLWTLAAAPLLTTLRRHWRDRSSVRPEVLPSAVVLALLVGAVVAVPAVRDRLPEFIPHLHVKVRFLTGVALILAEVGAVSIWLIRGRLEQIAEQGATRQTLRAYLGLRSELERLLGVLGAIIGMAVLASAALRNVELDYASLHPEKNIAFPAENVILYGLVLSVVLALVYLPTYATLQRTGATFRDAIARFPEPEDFEEDMARRRTLDELLGLRLSATASFRAGVAILSPLIGSVLGLLPKLGS